MFELITLQQQLYGSMFIQNECYIQNCTQSTCQYSTAHICLFLCEELLETDLCVLKTIYADAEVWASWTAWN